MSKRYPSTKFTNPPHVPGPIEEEGENSWAPTRYVPTYRTLVAGVGFTEDSGGNLEKDRKFELLFGDQEGTVAEGNDSRFSDKREWSAELPTEEELKKGTEKEPRKLSPYDLRFATESWWEESGLNKRLETLEKDSGIITNPSESGNDTPGLPTSRAGLYFSPIKNVILGSSDLYKLSRTDIGRTLVFHTSSKSLNITMDSCFGSLGDEIYFVAQDSFIPNPLAPICFYTEVDLRRRGGDIIKIPPTVASGLEPSFRDSRSIVCLKKCFDGGVGMDEWLLFGDLASGEAD